MTKKLLLILFLITSCGDDFSKQSKLGKLRVLAIKADNPEINSAATVTLTPLISFVDGGDITLNYSWQACPDPGIDVGSAANCDSSPAGLKLSGAGTFNTNTLAATFYTGSATDISVIIPVSAFNYLATLDSKIQFNGLDFIVILTYSDPNSGTSTSAFKTIKLSTKAVTSLNLNPTTGAIQFNGSTLVAFPPSEGKMTVASLSSAESYDVQTNTGTLSILENMYISWFSSAGEFVYNRTNTTDQNTFRPSGTSGAFVIVFRDDRGGVSTQLVSF
jgi:hypothetical protein